MFLQRWFTLDEIISMALLQMPLVATAWVKLYVFLPLSLRSCPHSGEFYSRACGALHDTICYFADSWLIHDFNGDLAFDRLPVVRESVASFSAQYPPHLIKWFVFHAMRHKQEWLEEHAHYQPKAWYEEKNWLCELAECLHDQPYVSYDFKKPGHINV